MTSRIAFERPENPLQFMLDEIAKVQRGESLEDLMKSKPSTGESLEELAKTSSKSSRGESLEGLARGGSKLSRGESLAKHSIK